MMTISIRLLSDDPNDIDWMGELIGDFQSPLLTGQQPAIHVLQYLSAGHRRLLPHRVLVGKHLTLMVDLGAIVGVDVEVVSRHDGMSRAGSSKLNSLEAATVPPTRVWT